MLLRTKRSFLEFQSDDSSDVLTPEVRRIGGLTTPPASPEKKMKSTIISDVELLDNVRQKNQELRPTRLLFGKNPLFTQTKALLQKSSSLNVDEAWLPTRKEHYERIMSFLDKSIGSSASHENCLYITGPPGSGKTAQMDLIIREKFHELVLGCGNKLPSHEANVLNTSYFECADGNFKSVALTKINCIALKTGSDVYTKIYNEFSSKTLSERKMKASLEDVETFIRSKPNTSFVLILDEMDKLATSGSQYGQATKLIVDLFVLTKSKDINLTLIGIANSLDMKDKFLAHLNIRTDILPDVLGFQPYTCEQMVEIVKSKLSKSHGSLEVFQPMAITFAAKKCAGNTGDLRKLVDLLRASVEVLETESLKKDPNVIGARVTIAHVAKVVSTYMNHPSRKTKLTRLNVQQKVVLCCIVNKEKYDLFRGKNTIDEVYDYYTKLLQKSGVMNPLGRSEFYESCNALQTFGVVSIEKKRTKRNRETELTNIIKSLVDDNEFIEEIGKLELLKRLL